MPRTRTTKKLAQRIDLDYFKRPSPLRRWRLWLSVTALALAIFWIAWYGVRGDRRVYSAGGLSTAHAVLTARCSACHDSSLGFFDEKISDGESDQGSILDGELCAATIALDRRSSSRV